MAVTSEVGIYNLALNAIGERSNISSPSETSRPAEVCRLWYEIVRNQILAAAPWPEAMRIEYLALVTSDDGDTWVAGDPREGYTYSYVLPADCLRPRYLDTFQKFLLTTHDNEKRLHCNVENAKLVYTCLETNVSLWSPDLLMAVVYGLASHICNPLSGKPSRARILAEEANVILTSARVNAANSDTEMHEAVPEWISARGYNFSPQTRYYHPHGSLLSTSTT